MLDSIKVAIPLSKSQHARLISKTHDEDAWQWCQFNPTLGELRFVRHKNLIETDGESFHRQLRFDFDTTWTPKSRLILEFSVPKFWYGHNIHLLYGWIDALKQLKKLIEEQFKLTRMKLPQVEDWHILRADFCYAWRFPTQEKAQAYFDSLRAMTFPYKQPVIRPTSIGFPGETYTVKVYLKRPEFFTHDRKELLKSNASLEWINHLELLSTGVLRFEISARKRWLNRNGIYQVSDILHKDAHLVFDRLQAGQTLEDAYIGFMGVMQSMGVQGRQILDGDFSSVDSGKSFTPEARTYRFRGADGDVVQHYIENPVGFRLYKHGAILEIIIKMLKKFVGGGAMLSDHQVQAKLMDAYTSQKAARLTAFWVYVQRFGLDKTKETFGKNSYYSARSDLKKAGVDLLERPDNVVFLDDEFLSRFRLKAPSSDVTNSVDDFRDSGNVLNLPKRA